MSPFQIARRRVVSFIWVSGLFTLFAIVIFTTNDKYERMCVISRQLQSQEVFDNTACDGDCLRDQQSVLVSSDSQPDTANTSALELELKELKQKLEMYERMNEFTQIGSWVNKFGSKRRQNILIISSLQSGSSILSEMFNKHKDIFHLNEPLQSLEYYRKHRPEAVYDTMTVHLLNGIFHCNFAELSYYANFMSNQYSALKHRLASRALSSPPMCPSNHRVLPYFSIRMCSPIKSETLGAICQLHQHTVVKTSDFTSIHKLSYLMDTSSNIGMADFSMRVVHLVRDPRALVYILIEHDPNAMNWTLDDLRKKSRDVCNELLKNIQFAVSAPPWLKGKYSLIRYEDLTARPHQIAEQLYQFVGISVSPAVRKWIDKITHLGSYLHNQGYVDDIDIADARNLIRSASKWRQRAPYFIAKLVEEECFQVMGLLGYKITKTEEELRNIHIPLSD